MGLSGPLILGLLNRIILVFDVGRWENHGLFEILCSTMIFPLRSLLLQLHKANKTINGRLLGKITAVCNMAGVGPTTIVFSKGIPLVAYEFAMEHCHFEQESKSQLSNAQEVPWLCLPIPEGNVIVSFRR